MLSILLNKQKEVKSILVMALFFMIFMSVYTMLDYFNGGYKQMTSNYGLYLTIINVIINVTMASISAFMMSMSVIFYKYSGKEGKGTFFSGLSVIFGIFTYGCTSCVIAFFATIGITFGVAVLPLAGLPYKLISLVLVVVGLLWLLREMKHATCKINLK